MEKVSVCFVCLGNICRSPTAEGVFRKLVEDAGLTAEIEIDSAGTGTWHIGHPADSRSRQVASGRGYELASIARGAIVEDFERFDYVLAMDEQNLRDLEQLRRSAGATTTRAQLCLFRDFDATAPARSSVPDPYYGGSGGFDEVLDICERACKGLLAHLKEARKKAL